MHAIPTKRLLVYIALGVVVLVVGTVGLVSLRGGDSSEEGFVVDTGATPWGLAGSSSGNDGAGGGGGLGATGQVGSVAAAGDPAAGQGTGLSSTSTTAPRIWVQVAGAVHRPGVYEMSAHARVFEAVIQAGGFTDEADQEAVALAATLTDGCRVYVPRTGEAQGGTVEVPEVTSEGMTNAGSAGSVAAGAAADVSISLNSATAQELDALPGIGPAIAQQIITYRETHGPFTSVDQLTDVPGIGQARLEQLRPLVSL